MRELSEGRALDRALTLSLRQPALDRPSPIVAAPAAPPTDTTSLVEALRANQPGAKAFFFERYAKLVERIVTHVLGFDAELADVLQDVFAGAFSSIHTLKDPAALEAWLSSVAALTARKVLRTRARRAWLRRFIDSDEEERYEPIGSAPDVEARRALGSVYAVLGRLPADERIAFALRYIDGMELVEVAGASQVSLATIKRRLARAERRFLANAKNYPELGRWISGGARWHDR
jgi:RNA polymerase sigma-70 factor, ECF subfamily